MHPLITTEQLARALDEVVLCDIRWDLTDRGKGRQTYSEGHIPGAVFVDLDLDLSSPPGKNGRHPLPDLDDFAATLSRLGMTPRSHVVAYDDVGGRIAARLWWMLRSIGHQTVQVLDGGYRAWTEEGRPSQTGPVSAAPAHYPTPKAWTGVVTHDQIGDRTLIDARAPERYRGEVEPVDPVPGHIPGAFNVPTDANLSGGRFKPAADLGEIYRQFPDDVVVSCGSGVTACHDALAMVVAGHPLPDVYVGSYSEWSRRGLPVQTGDDE